MIQKQNHQPLQKQIYMIYYNQQVKGWHYRVPWYLESWYYNVPWYLEKCPLLY